MSEQTIQMETMELSGPFLDWAVAVALKLPVELDAVRTVGVRVVGWEIGAGRPYTGPFNPSHDPIFGLIIADQYALSSGKCNPLIDGEAPPELEWWAKSFDDTVETFGRNRLEAMLRNIVLAEVGHAVDVPVLLVG